MAPMASERTGAVTSNIGDRSTYRGRSGPTGLWPARTPEAPTWPTSGTPLTCAVGGRRGYSGNRTVTAPDLHVCHERLPSPSLTWAVTGNGTTRPLPGKARQGPAQTVGRAVTAVQTLQERAGRRPAMRCRFPVSQVPGEREIAVWSGDCPRTVPRRASLDAPGRTRVRPGKPARPERSGRLRAVRARDRRPLASVFGRCRCRL
jgi:hypothetical protein